MRDLLIQLLQQQLPVQVLAGTVLAVNRDAATCDVQPLDTTAPEFFDVRLRAVDDEQLSGLILWPRVGSIVLVGLVDNDRNTAFLSLCSEVDSFTLSTPNESLLTLLQDLIQSIQRMVFTTNAGPTVQLLNAAEFDRLAQRLSHLLSA